jgi:hypothetical protein
MSAEEAIEKFENFQNSLTATLPAFVAQSAMDAKALIQDRIQEAGNNSYDIQLGNYTSEPYIKKRKKGGRQTAYVDLTMTRGGAGMFGSTGIVLEEANVGVVHVKVAGKDSFTQNKLDWNSERYGDVLEVSKKEEALIFESFGVYLDGLIQDSGL